MAKLQGQGEKRSIDISGLDLKGLQYDVEILITGEQLDKAAQMETLNTALGMVASNPQVLQDPKVSKLFGKVLELSGGISPVEILGQPQTAQQPQGTPQQVGAEAQAIA